MIDLVKEFLKSIIKLVGEKINERYSGPSVDKLYVPSSAQISPFQRFQREFSQNYVIIMSLILVLAITTRIYLIYAHQSIVFKVDESMPLILEEYIQLELSILVVISFILCGLLIFLCVKYFWLKRRLETKVVFSLIIVLIAIGSLISTEQTEAKIQEVVEYQAHEVAFRNYLTQEEEKCRLASEQYTQISKFSQNPESVAEARGLKAGSDLCLGDTVEAVKEYAKLIYENPNYIKPEHVTSLHWAIYDLGEKYHIQDATKIIEEIQKQYPIDELSLIMLGINREKNWMFVERKLYAATLNNNEDEIKLRYLIDNYPNDKYVDIARILVGEHQFVADHNNDSYVRDMALAKTALEAYQSMDFLKSIDYSENFLFEYPTHQQRDLIAFNLARSYELSGNIDQAIETIIDVPSRRLYAVALIDYYLDSDQIMAIIDSNYQAGELHRLPLLEFSLAEQYLKELDFSKANEQFERVLLTYGYSEEAQYVPRNLELLESILLIDSINSPEKAISLAKYFMKNPYDFRHDSMIIYNDLYAGYRKERLRYIGLFGPDWEYVKQTNDHLVAADILEDFIISYPNNSRIDEAIYLMINAYYNLAYSSSYTPTVFGGDEAFVEERPQVSEHSHGLILQKLEELANRMLIDYPDSTYTPESLSLVAIGYDNFDNHEKAISYMMAIVEHYPDNNLANNAMIYVARKYVDLASMEFEANLKMVYLARAEESYNRVINDYPEGHVGDEAELELVRVQKEISEFEQLQNE